MPLRRVCPSCFSRSNSCINANVPSLPSTPSTSSSFFSTCLCFSRFTNTTAYDSLSNAFQRRPPYRDQQELLGIQYSDPQQLYSLSSRLSQRSFEASQRYALPITVTDMANEVPITTTINESGSSVLPTTSYVRHVDTRYTSMSQKEMFRVGFQKKVS
ncbi:hypothetical protein M3Y96_00015400 [Aphelenchoides besseyi]|nr:hypothetical protein M3Y96_00015400 [Aphelenchoides besseyi]